MRRKAVAVFLATLVVCGTLVRAQERSDPTDALLSALETGLASGDVDGLVAAGVLDAAHVDWLRAHVPTGQIDHVVIRERARATHGVMADVFVSQGARAFVAAWILEIAPDDDAASGVRVIGLTEMSRFDDLLHLGFDDATAYAVTGLEVRGPDFEVSVPDGSMFLSTVDDGPTAMVVLGRARVRFTPADPAEQGQLRIYAGESSFETEASEVFVRLNPAHADAAVRWTSREAIAADRGDVAEARAVFDDRVGLSYHLDLGDLAPGRWSIEPAPGSLLVDFRDDRRGWLTYTRAPEEAEDVALFHRGDGKQISLYAHAPSSGAGAAPAAEVRHTMLDVTFDPARQWLSGLATLSIELHRPAASILLRLDESLGVSSAWSPEIGPVLPLRPAGYDMLVVALPPSFTGNDLTLHLQYQGRAEPQQLSDDRMIADQTARRIPAAPFAPEPRYLYTVGGWWYPQIAGSGHATATIRVTVPAEYHARATGRLLTTTTSAPAEARWPSRPRAVATFAYRADRPVRYLSCLVTKMAPLDAATVGMPARAAAAGEPPEPDVVDVTAFVGRGQSTRTRNTAERAASIVGFYGRLLGGAPYPSLALVTLTDVVPGGHSPAYFSMLNVPHAATPLSWRNDPVTFRDAPDFFLAHEIAHQWWGQAVAARTYHDRWISEGFAQYMAWQYTTSVEGEEAGHRLMSRMRATSEGLTAEGPIRLGFRLGHLRSDARVFRSLVYNKSAVVLHMLRRLIGDDRFENGLERLFREQRYRRTSTDDVRRVFEAEAGRPLSRFFDRWINDAAVPTLRFRWSQPSPDHVLVEVEQLGATFDVPFSITIEHERDGVVSRLLRIGEARETIRVPVDGAVRRVLFDDPLTLATVVE